MYLEDDENVRELERPNHGKYSLTALKLVKKGNGGSYQIDVRGSPTKNIQLIIKKFIAYNARTVRTTFKSVWQLEKLKHNML